MKKNYLLFELDVVDNKSKELLEELQDLARERGFSVRKVYSAIKDKEGNLKFLKGVRTETRQKIIYKLKNDEFVSLIDFKDSLALSWKVSCIIDTEDKKRLKEFKSLFNYIFDLVNGVESANNSLEPSSVFGKDEDDDYKLFEENYSNLFELYLYINENKFRLKIQEILYLTKRIDYLNSRLKDICSLMEISPSL